MTQTDNLTIIHYRMTVKHTDTPDQGSDFPTHPQSDLRIGWGKSKKKLDWGNFPKGSGGESGEISPSHSYGSLESFLRQDIATTRKNACGNRNIEDHRQAMWGEKYQVDDKKEDRQATTRVHAANEVITATKQTMMPITVWPAFPFVRKFQHCTKGRRCVKQI